MKTTVVFHSADYDGLFCREIARKFLPSDTEFIGWDFKDPPIFSPGGNIYVMDLPIDRVFGLAAYDVTNWVAKDRVIWIDHHKSSIDSHPKDIPGYRIDGVAACRLAWQWFLSRDPSNTYGALPEKDSYINRKVSEPLAVRLAGEYDIWDHRGDGDLEFQFGLRAEKAIRWDWLLSLGKTSLSPSGQITFREGGDAETDKIITQGKSIMDYQNSVDSGTIKERGFLANFEGMVVLCLNTARFNSATFAARDVPETGHTALAGFYFDGTQWNVSLYHAAHRKDIDLSEIAKKHGGGGHRGACGFRSTSMPFAP
jgi:hypothetical protein